MDSHQKYYFIFFLNISFQLSCFFFCFCYPFGMIKVAINVDVTYFSLHILCLSQKTGKQNNCLKEYADAQEISTAIVT